MINKHQKVKFQSFQFENENNMPSKDGIVHEYKQLLMQIEKMLSIVLSKPLTHKKMSNNEYEYQDEISSNVS